MDGLDALVLETPFIDRNICNALDFDILLYLVHRYDLNRNQVKILLNMLHIGYVFLEFLLRCKIHRLQLIQIQLYVILHYLILLLMDSQRCELFFKVDVFYYVLNVVELQ